MFKDRPSGGNFGRSTMKNSPFEARENEFESSHSHNQINYPPPRTPLNSIPDPSQYQKEPQESDAESLHKSEFVLPGRPSDKRAEASSDRFGNLGLSYGTARVSGRSGKAHSEPNSAQSTPARNASRVSLGGAAGICAGSRVPQFSGGRGGSSCASLKGMSTATSELGMEVPHFKLKDDPSFWNDHSVQVLIRIRPLSDMEMLSQGYGRCLRQESAQTLLWLGHPETRFTFDHVACESLSQENLFGVTGVPMVENCLSGYNSCMFAYGQTGSGKTYTMMGEIKEPEGHLTEDSGITPRVFDYLFMRIKAEEESRRDYKLKYSCKCSFLEIYNEQITDLLEPSSTNLQLREDMKKGVYVENLTEHNVETVNDVLRLLLQGTVNRKVVATHMNCESSRSHSVFTCIIERRWEKDYVTHFRSARLNLVDLAGSERQKSSGADNDRLKEAANINKSLSTLGLVIMTLVDTTHGKPRHVPYRDSRLTFLLQDSLGGNSKTMIIANISPSICSANETLSTLKFAQRAKLIENNAKVNEDASGDISALQWQIQQLKGQLSFLMKNENFACVVSNLSNLEPNSERCRLSQVEYDSLGERVTGNSLCLPNNEIKCMNTALFGALRREKTAETTIQNLQAEIECMKCLARQMEEDSQRSLVKLRLYEEKIKQLELLVDDKLSAEKYLLEENNALHGEIQLLEASIDRNPESCRLALENDRLFQQLQVFHNFYGFGERERLLTELSELRDQLLVTLQEKLKFSMKKENQDIDTEQDLEVCRNLNSKLLRDVDRLQTELGKYLNHNQVRPDAVETLSMKNNSGDEMSSSTWAADDGLANIIKENALGASVLFAEGNEDNSKVLEAKLEKMSKDLEEVKLLNDQYQEKWAVQLSQKQQIEIVCEEVEMETTRTILHLQEEVASLQSELEERLCSIVQENTQLKNTVAAKEGEIRTLCLEWERAILEITTFLLDGSRSLKDACGQVKSITHSFPQVNAWISEHVGMAVKSYVEKEETIQQLQRSLEDAQKMVLDMEMKITSLKEATLTLSAFQQVENNEGMDESIQLRMLLNEKTNKVRMLEDEIKCKNYQLYKAAKQAEVSFLVVKWLSDNYNVARINDAIEDISTAELDVQARLGSNTISDNQGNNLILNDPVAQVELTKLEVLGMKNAVNAFCADTEGQTAAIQTGVLGISSAYRDFIQDLDKETQDIRMEVWDLKMHHRNSEHYTVDSPISNVCKYTVFVNQLHHTLHQIIEQLVEMNKRLNIMENCISTKVVSSFPLAEENILDADELSADSSSVSDLSTETENNSSESKLHGSPYISNFKFPAKVAGQMVHLKSERGIVIQSDDHKSPDTTKLLKRPTQNEAVVSCLSKELDAAYNCFNRLYGRLSALLKELHNESHSYPTELKKKAPSFQLRMQKAGEGSENDREVFGYSVIKPADSFLSKFVEAHETVKEADRTIHALTKAYEESKQLNVKWKQAGENLMVERESMAEEIQLLKSSMSHKEEESRSLKDHVHFSLIELANSVSVLEECFLQVQTDVEKRFMTVYSDIHQLGQEMLSFMNNQRSSLEDICSQIVYQGFASSVLHNCYVRELLSKCSYFSVNPDSLLARLDKLHELPKICSSGVEPVISIRNEGMGKVDQSVVVKILQEEPELSNVKVIYENMALRKELERKQELLEGLLFDFRLLQESASNNKDIKDQTEKLIFSLGQVRYELEIKSSQLEDILVQNRKLEGSLADTERALTASNYELRVAKESIDKLSDQNAELRELLVEVHAKKSEAEGQLDEHKEVIGGLENEIANLTASLESQSLSVLEGFEDELRMVIRERDQLQEEVCILSDKLEMAYSLVDEKEAIAMEAREESESSKIYAEQKEEEVKILEHSVEELDHTINVLEKKVYEMDEEVGRHRLIRDSLEMELHALKERLLAVDSISHNPDSDSTSVQQTEEQISRQHKKIVELHEALNRIKLLEEEKADQDKEIKKCREYISEIVLHAEAQAMQYQQKYKCLESMFREVRTEMSSSMSTVPTSEKIETSSIRTRGSSSPFRCFTNIVQQMNQEKDQELKTARLRVEELEALAANRQKEVCMLQTRLAAAESMTHDVIRDLLGVKLDITNYANLIDQNQLVKLVEDAHHQRKEFSAKEKELLNLRVQINDLIEERERCISVLKTKEADTLAAQIAVQQLEERDQLLSAQNEMLKMDKTNLTRKVAELADMVKTLFGARNSQQHVPQSSSKIKDKGAPNLGNVAFNRRSSQSEWHFSRVNDELAHYCKSAGNNLHG